MFGEALFYFFLDTGFLTSLFKILHSKLKNNYSLRGLGNNSPEGCVHVNDIVYNKWSITNRTAQC